MKPEEVAFGVAKQCIVNDLTKKNAVGAVIGAIATVGVVGATGPIAVPLALAVGALAGAKGESTVKGVAKGTVTVAGNVAKGAGSVAENVAKGAGSVAGNVASGAGSIFGNVTKGITGGITGVINFLRVRKTFLSKG